MVTEQYQKDRLILISELQEKIHLCLSPHIGEAPISIVDFPDIRNCGDSAIWLGEMAYLKNRYRTRPTYVSRMGDFSRGGLIKRAPEGPIFIHGGGNFGDIWVAHQDFRERVLTEFPDRAVIQFPQSIHFASNARLDQAARTISKHRNFTLLVRDEESLSLATKRFDCRVELCPDMAFCIGAITPVGKPSLAVLAMLRADAESTGEYASSNLGVPVDDWISESELSVRISKLKGRISAVLSGHPSEIRLRKLDAAAHNRFNRGVRQLSQARAIVTDRLHVHIISLLLGLPHAVLDNSYGKVRRFMGAFSGSTPYSYLPATLEEGIAWARERAENN